MLELYWKSNINQPFRRPLGRLNGGVLGVLGGSARLGSARLGSARLGSARLGSARLGSTQDDF
jgi:hypothetical protein